MSRSFTRLQLEQEAVSTCSPDDYYDLMDTIDTMEDAELEAMIKSAINEGGVEL